MTANGKPARPTADETSALIERVAKLRYDNGLDTATIGEIVGRHRTTVSRLLAAYRRRLAGAYKGARFDPMAVAALIVDRFERASLLAMQQYTIATETRDKLRALRTAVAAEREKKVLLQDVGLLPRDLGMLRVEAQREHVSAAEVRRLAAQLRKLNDLPADNTVWRVPLVSDGEREWIGGNGTPADREDDDTP